MNFNPSKPIYEQIIDEFKKKMVRGELQPDDKMPSQRDLAQQLKVNPNTVQRAYREMEHQGMTETQRGQGTFVANDTEKIRELKDEMAKKTLENFIQEIQDLGFSQEDIPILIEKYRKKGDKN